MTLKTSLFKSGIFRYQIKRYWWISALYTFFLFMFSTFELFSENKNWLISRYIRVPNNVYYFFRNSAHHFLVVIIAVILGVCVFRYLQTTRSVALFHAMPVTRSQLYNSSVLAGAALLLLPVIVNALIMVLLSTCFGYALALPLSMIANWVFSHALSGLAVFCFTVFVGIFAGNSVAQFIFVFILCVLPMGICSIGTSLLEGWLFSFTRLSLSNVTEWLERLVPILLWPIKGANYSWDWLETGICMAYILLFFGGGLFFYHKRKAECAGDLIAFSWLRPVFLYGVSFCVMLVGGAVVNNMLGIYKQANIFVYLLFALLGYVVAKILLTKSFRIWRYYKGYIGFVVFVVAVYFSISFNIFGYGMHPPQAEKIETAYVGMTYATHSLNPCELVPKEGFSEMSDGFFDAYYPDGDFEKAFFRSQEGIKEVIHFQEEAVKFSKSRSYEELAGVKFRNNSGVEEITIIYWYKSGKKEVHTYFVETDSLYDLYSTPDAKDSLFSNLRVHPERIGYIRTDYNNDEKAHDFFYGEEKEELIECIQTDLENLTHQQIQEDYFIAREGLPYEATKASRQYLLVVAVQTEENAMPNQTFFLQLNANFVNTLAWLDAHEN